MRIIKILILIFFYSNLLSAQQVYKGEYVFNGLEGEAVFEFKRGKDDEVIKHGNFQFFRKEIDSLDHTIFYKTEITGRYSENKKSGNWFYKDEEHQVMLQDVADFEVNTELNSQQIRLNAAYTAGNPEGNWSYIENKFSEGTLRRVAEVEEIRFQNADMVGKFQYKEFEGERTHFVNGELTAAGLMNGEWSLVYENGGTLISEVRNYENGFLLSLVTRDLLTDQVINESVFFKTIEKLNQVNKKENVGFRVADEKFGIFFNDGFLKDFDEYQVQVPGNEFLSGFMKNILRYDERFVNPEGEIIEYPIHTKRFVFEIKRDEQVALLEIPAKFSSIKNVVQDYATKNALNLNRSQSDSLAFAHAFFQEYADKVQEMEELIRLIDSKEIQYFDLRYFMERDLPFLAEKEKITYNYEGDQKEKPLSYELKDPQDGFLIFLNDYLDQMGTKIERQKTIVDSALFRIQQDEGLKKLQENIQEQKENLDQLYLDVEGLREEGKVLMRAVHQNILVESFNNLGEMYAQAEDFEEKRKIGEVMLDLLSEMKSQHEPLSKIFQLNAKLDQLYMEEIFNPFTYTRYEQRIKERLYDAGQRLFDHYIYQIKSEKNYTEIKNWIKKIENLNVRMAELLEEDTRRLERRLNRRLSISRIESLLDL